MAKVQPVSVSEWEREADRWETFSFFQTPQWLDILCKAFDDFQNRTVRLEGPSGVAVLLPLVRSRKAPGLYSWLSLPYGTYGGPLAERGAKSRSWDLVRAYLEGQRFSAVNLTLPPGTRPPDWKGYRVHSLTTQVLDLRPGFSSVMDRCFSAACRRAIRKAERSRIEIRLLEKELFFEPFFVLYEQSMKRWGLNKGFSPRLFELLWAASGVQYWGALHQGQLVSAALILTQGSHQYYWLGVMDEATQSLRPNNLLFSRILEHSCQNAVETFDLGNSDGLIGVFNFKKSFGPEVVTYAQLYRASPWVQGYRLLRSLLR